MGVCHAGGCEWGVVLVDVILLLRRGQSRSRDVRTTSVMCALHFVTLTVFSVSSDWDNAAYIVPLVIVFIPLVLALFGCYKICKYDSKPENIAEEQLRIEHYGYGQTYNWKQRLQQKKMPSVV